VLRVLLFGESAHPCIRRGPQTRGDKMPEKTQPVWARFCVFGQKSDKNRNQQAQHFLNYQWIR
jgi:hypothetical protein